MSANSILTQAGYNPGALLDYLKARKELTSDAQLAKALEVAPPMISKLRHGKLPIGPSILLKIHDATDTPARELRKMMGVLNQ
jgi:transcriptional regulator with XRE-family HTH domain